MANLEMPLQRVIERAFPGARIEAFAELGGGGVTRVVARRATSCPGPPIHRPDISELTMREGHRRFVERALFTLGSRP